MLEATLLLEAKLLKETLFHAVNGKNLQPLTHQRNPYHHPLAEQWRNKALTLSEREHQLISECQNSAKLVITPENQQILLNYFRARQAQHDNLGNLYKTLSFSDFILRLFTKRFKEVYLDGRAIVLRDGSSYGGIGGKAFLENIGTNNDNNNLYLEYLTLEETVLSTLVLPQATSIVIGTGSRSSEARWDIEKEFNESIDIAVFSYPAAAEFRGGNTAHYDLFFIVEPTHKSNHYLEQIRTIKQNPALMQAARSIYGDSFAFDEQKLSDSKYVTLQQSGETFTLNKKAYLHRTKNVLKSILLAADAQMKEKELGTTFQLKGLGLGAFSFSGDANTKILEELYLKALRSVLRDTELNLRHIRHINIINLPSDLQDPRMINATKGFGFFNNIHVGRTVMDPTRKTDGIKTGAVVVCGDSGSKFGNEGNIGLDRSSSDDPAAQYSLLDPLILDPDTNLRLKDKNCIKLINQGVFENIVDVPAGSISPSNNNTTSSKNTLRFVAAFLLGAALIYTLAPSTILIPLLAAYLFVASIGTILYRNRRAPVHAVPLSHPRSTTENPEPTHQPRANPPITHLQRLRQEVTQSNQEHEQRRATEPYIRL